MSESRDEEVCCYFPDDLWFQILSFLPVKTLVRFRAVSKSLMTVIDDPDFVSFHLRSFPANRHETQLYVIAQPTLSGARPQIHEAKPPACNKLTEFHLRLPWQVRGSIDGLVLLSMISLIQKRAWFMLWNPSTGKKRQLPLPQRFVPVDVEALALGYDHLRRDYKVFLLQNRHRYTIIDLYSVGKGSWTKTLDNINGGDNVGFFQYNSVSFSGGVVWNAWSRFNGGRQRLALFDFAAETVRHATLPFFAFWTYNVFKVDDGGCCLGMLAGDECVWVLDTVTMTWTGRYGIGAAHVVPRSLDRLWSLVRIKQNNNGEIMVLLERFKGERIKLVQVGLTETKEVRCYPNVDVYGMVAGIYVESLVKL